MTWAAALSRADIGEYLAETYDMTAQQHGAYALLTMRYLLAGPLPFDEKRLADIARVSKHMWTKRIWPMLQEFFTPGEDGLVHHEELDQVRRAAASGTETRRSVSARNAVRTRWEREAERKAQQLVLPDGGASPESDRTPADTSAAHGSVSSPYDTPPSSVSPEVSNFNARGKNSYENRDTDRMPDASRPLRASSL